MYQCILYHWWNRKLTRNAQGANRKGNAIGVMNVESTSILSVLGFSSDKKGHGSARILKNKGLEKGSLIQHKMISCCIIFKWDTSC